MGPLAYKLRQEAKAVLGEGGKGVADLAGRPLALGVLGMHGKVQLLA